MIVYPFILLMGDFMGTDTNSALRPILCQELVSVPILTRKDVCGKEKRRDFPGLWPSV